jgi:sec-independent protein translocase protein TatB
MNFLGVGPMELALVAVIAVIVIGPERIPEVAVQVARVVRSLRGFATDATSGLRKELDELTKEYDDLHKEFRDLRDSLNKDATSIAEDLTRSVDESIVEASGEPPPARNPDGS